MTVIVAALDAPALDIRIEGTPPDYDHVTGEFSLECPRGDDWLQRIRHTPNPAPALVRIEQRTMFVIFLAPEDAARFESWLYDARREQQHGYNTMRG